MNGKTADSLFEIRMFYHIFRSKHVIQGTENDHLQKLKLMHCLAGMHRGFSGCPTRGSGGPGADISVFWIKKLKVKSKFPENF